MSYILTSEKLNEVLTNYDVPSSFSHFNEPIAPPFITWISSSTDNFNADNSVYHKVENLTVELYTRGDTLEQEKKLESYFEENGILWDKSSQTWIDDDKVMMSIYEVG